MATSAALITNFEATELRLGLPGTDDQDENQFISYNNVSCSCSSSSKTTNKRALSEMTEESRVTTNFSALDSEYAATTPEVAPPPAKTQVVGWPPIRSYRRNNLLQTKKIEIDGGGMFVKVRMDGAPYLRKIDLKGYKSYPELIKALESMFKFTIGEFSEREGYNGSEFVPTYEDKDGDWMLVGDVPWGMFISTCKKLRIMKGSKAKGLRTC